MSNEATNNKEAENNFGSKPWSLTSLLDDGAKIWNNSWLSLILICSVPFIVALTGIITALIGKDAYKWFTGEDRFAENLQVLFWTITCILGLLVAWNIFKEGERLIGSLYVFLCIGIFFLIGEELSWGQRIFGWITPESMSVINKQNETNIHTIYGVDSAFKWIHLIIGAYGTFLPILLVSSKKLSRFRPQLSKLIPHYTLIPYFFLPFIWRIYRNFFGQPKKYYFAIAEYAEVMELILSIAFVFFMIF